MGCGDLCVSFNHSALAGVQGKVNRFQMLAAPRWFSNDEWMRLSVETTNLREAR
jgi:hypothetical protein